MTLAEFIEMMKEHAEARETLRQEQQHQDNYLNQIYLTKLYRNDPKMRTILNRGSADDVTANQKVRFRVKAVALDYDNITRWLERSKSKIRQLLKDLDLQTLSEGSI